MSAIAVFGAGGQLGRLVVAEAARRGHEVTAVVRDPAKHQDLAADRVTVRGGDVRDQALVAEVAAGHEVVVSSVYSPEFAGSGLYPAAAAALLAGVGTAARLIVVGVSVTREIAPGVRALDAPGFPAEYREFALARLAEQRALEAAEPGVDWLLLLPPDEIDRPALAVELLEEIEGPRRRGAVVAGG